MLILLVEHSHAIDFGDYASARLVSSQDNAPTNLIEVKDGDVIFRRDFLAESVVYLNGDLDFVFNPKRNKRVTVAASTPLFLVETNSGLMGYCAAVAVQPKWCFFDTEKDGQFDMALSMVLPVPVAQVGAYGRPPVLVGGDFARHVPLPGAITYSSRDELPKPAMEGAFVFNKQSMTVSFFIKHEGQLIPYGEKEFEIDKDRAVPFDIDILGARLEVTSISADGTISSKLTQGFPQGSQFKFYLCLPPSGALADALVGPVVRDALRPQLSCRPFTVMLTREARAHSF